MLTRILRFNFDKDIYGEPPKCIIIWEDNINYCEKYFSIYEIKGTYCITLLVLTTIYYIVLCTKQT